MLQAIGEHLGVTQSSGGAVGLTTREIFQATLQDFKGAHYKALFATKRFGLHTALTWLIWLTIGISRPRCQTMNGC